MRATRQERRELARHVANLIDAWPEGMLPALDVLIGATRPGRAGVILVVGGEDVRVSFVVAGAERVAETVEAFDTAYAAVPGQNIEEFADAKSSH